MDVRGSIRKIEPAAGLAKLAGYPFLLLSWVAEDGYPLSAAVNGTVDTAAGTIELPAPAGLTITDGHEVSVTGSHIHPQPGFGYDERRHVTMWGPVSAGPDRRTLTFRPTTGWGWDEAEEPFPEYVERSVAQSRRYFGRLSTELGRTVRPRLSLGWLTLRATRLPFLSATFIPVLIGIAIAATHGFFDPLSAVLTIIGAAAVHLGLNVANDVFDTRSGADDMNVNPTQYSGGSRVIQYGLVSLGGMQRISAACYAVALAVGVALMVLRGSPALLVIGIAGIVLSLAYTAPPFKLVYRGLGEITTALGFGPIMLLGAYVVQTRGLVSLEALVASIPVAILVALILYVNEIPDRPADARAGKRTLPVQLPKQAVLALYALLAVAAFAVVVAGVAVGLLPLPALAVLVALPLVRRVHDGLGRMYESPYGLMAIMAVNIRIHLIVGGLLLASYLAVLAAAAVAPGVRLFIR